MPSRLGLLTALVATAIAPAALALPKVLVCADDAGDGSGQTLTTGLKGTMAFGAVDLMDCAQDSPTLAALKKYDAVLTFSNGAYFDPQGLGDNLADYTMAGGGVVQMMFNLDGFSGPQGKWIDTFECFVPGPMGLLFQMSSLKAMPNEPQSPLVVGAKGVSASLRGDGTLNKMRGAISVWDFADGHPGICRMMVGNRPRVDLNWYAGDARDVGVGDGVRLVKNALLYVSGGFNPIQGMPNQIMFPDTGTFAVSAPQTATYTNTGMAQLMVTALGLTGQNPGDFTIVKAPALPLAVAPNGTFTVDVAFSPVVAGGRLGALSATVAGQMATADVGLSGNAVPSALQVLPNPLPFNGTPLNTPVNKVVTITNKGAGKVSVTSVAVSVGMPPFSVSGLPGLPISLNAGGSFPFTATFNPAANGAFMGTLTIKSNDPNTPTIAVPLSGCAGPSGITLDSGTLAFGAVNLGASQVDTLTVTNSGCADLKVTDAQLGGANAADFVVDKAALIASPLTAGQGRSVNVTFKPQAMGARAATLTIVSAAGNKVVSLTGTGTTAMVKLMPPAIDFGKQAVMVASNPMPLTISDMGTGQLKVMAVTFGGPDAASFSSPGPAAPFAIDANKSSSIDVVCTAAKIGPLTATLTITTDVGNAAVNLSCTGVAPMISVTPAKLDFGSVFLMVTSMPQAVTITNTGTDTLNLMNVSFLGTSMGDLNSIDLPAMLPMALAPKASLVVHVTFTPSMHGMETDELDIDSDDPMNMSVAVPLSGNGVQAGISTDQAMLNFMGVAVESTKSLPLVIMNTGDVPVTLTSIATAGFFATDAKGGTKLDMGQSVTVHVSFTPAAPGPQSGMLTITPAGGLMPVVVALAGIGTPPSITATPSSLDFGAIEIGMTAAPRTVVVTNTGTTPLMLGDLGSNDLHFVADGTLIAATPTLMPGATTSFTVSFAPTSISPAVASIGLTLKGKTKPAVSVSATGTGVAPRAKGGCNCALGQRGGSGRGLGTALGLLLVALLARRRRGQEGVGASQP